MYRHGRRLVSFEPHVLLSIFIVLSASKRAHAQSGSSLESPHQFRIEGGYNDQGEYLQYCSATDLGRQACSGDFMQMYPLRGGVKHHCYAIPTCG